MSPFLLDKLGVIGHFFEKKVPANPQNSLCSFRGTPDTKKLFIGLRGNTNNISAKP